MNDKQRLDWLDEHFCAHMHSIVPKTDLKGLNFVKLKTVRQAIDDAIKKGKEKKP